MSKTKFKLLTCVFIVFVLISTFVFATDTNLNATSENSALIATSEENTSSTGTNASTTNDLIQNKDLYYDSSNSNLDIKDIIVGNVFASAKDLTLNPEQSGGFITGTLFAAANNVTLKSNVTYSSEEKDEEGNPALESVESASSIYGNAFIAANKVVIEPGCEVNGDLFIVANEIEISANSIIYGNVFATATKINVSGQIGGDLYVTSSSFELGYYGFIYRDLHLNTKDVNLKGYIYRNSFVDCNKFNSANSFLNSGNIEINSESINFAGEISGDANFRTTSLSMDTSDTCKIAGKLNYSANSEVETTNIVSGEVNYTKSSSINSVSKSFLSNAIEYLLSLLSTFVGVAVLYLFYNKFAKNLLQKLSNVTTKNMLISLGIGFLSLIIIPVLAVLLFVPQFTALLGFILLLLYVLLLIISVPTLIVTLSEFVNTKLSKKVNSWLMLLLFTIAYSIITIIPYLGPLFTVLFFLTGFGRLLFNICKK